MTAPTSAHHGRQIAPSRPQERTASQTLVSTVSNLSRHASSGFTSLTSAAAARGLALSKKPWQQQTTRPQTTGDAPTSPSAATTSPLAAGVSGTSPRGHLGTDVFNGSPSPIFEAMGGHRPEAAVHQDTFAPELCDLHSLLTSQEQITWAHLDWLPGGAVGPRPRQALFLAYATGGLQIYALDEDSDTLLEMINFQQVLFPDDRIAGRVLCAKAQKLASGKCRLIMVTEGDNASLVLATCSLDSHTVDRTYALPLVSSKQSQPADAMLCATLQIDQRHLVLAQSHPPAIHVLNALSLQPVHTPIIDVASASLAQSLPPPFHLAGRVLVYASTRVIPSDNVIKPPTLRAATAASSSPATKPFNPGPPHAKMTPEQVRAAAIEVGAQASDMAKRLGGGLRAGVRNLGDWSSPYLTQHAPTGAGAGAGGRGLHADPATTSSPNTSPSLAPLVNRERNSDVTIGDDETDVSRFDDTASATTVRIVEIGAGQEVVVAEFRGTRNNVACVKMDATGQLLLLADSLGHSFNVYEVMPLPACLRGPLAAAPSPPVLHRFKLLRGMTSAHVCDVFWSAHSKWVGVLTQTGTVHLYALGPLHGPHARPLGSTLTAMARSPRLDPPNAVPAGAAPTNAVSDPFALPGLPHDSRIPRISAMPTTLCTSNQRIANALIDGRTPERTGPFMDVLTFHPVSASLVLARVSPSKERSLDAMRQSVMTAGGAVTAAASSRVSGLTAMMRRSTSHPSALAQGQASPSASASASASASKSPTAPQTLKGSCRTLAIWNDLARTRENPEVRPSASDVEASSPPSCDAPQRPPRGWVSLAEVQTYDRTPRALSRPLYLSHQIQFHSWKHSSMVPSRVKSVLMDISRAAKDDIEVRVSVRITPGTADDGGDDVGLDADHFLYGEKLASAMAAADFENVDYGSSPSSRIPSFPQGQPARRPNWRASVANGITIPVRLGVAASREMSGLRAMRPGSAARRGPGRSDDSHSISFDEDVTHDAYIFADARAAQPSPNGEAASPPSRRASSSGGGRRDISSGSFRSARGTSLSPFARAAMAATSSPGEGSTPDTSPTTASDDGCASAGRGGGSFGLSFDDDDDDPGAGDHDDLWTAARGLQEDVEGDPLGWDSFPDPEFGVGTAKAPTVALTEAASERPAGEDFVVGGLVLDEDVRSHAVTTDETLPPFSRKAGPVADTATASSASVRASGAASSARSPFASTAPKVASNEQDPKSLLPPMRGLATKPPVSPAVVPTGRPGGGGHRSPASPVATAPSIPGPTALHNGRPFAAAPSKSTRGGGTGSSVIAERNKRHGAAS
ncbi:unnamed protein product [Parajaminaea phylloscopi]